jgi:hypothetical protein
VAALPERDGAGQAGNAYDSGFLVGALGCRRLQIAKFPVFFPRNRQQFALKKEGL